MASAQRGREHEHRLHETYRAAMALCNEGVGLDADRPVEAFERYAKATQIIRRATHNRGVPVMADVAAIRSRLEALEAQATQRMHAIERRLGNGHAPQAARNSGRAERAHTKSADPLASAAQMFGSFFKRPVSASDAATPRTVSGEPAISIRGQQRCGTHALLHFTTTAGVMTRAQGQYSGTQHLRAIRKGALTADCRRCDAWGLAGHGASRGAGAADRCSADHPE